MSHVLVQHGLVVFVLRILWIRHADAIGDMPALVKQPGRIGLGLLRLEAVDISGVQRERLPSTIAIVILRRRFGGNRRGCCGWRSRSTHGYWVLSLSELP